MPWLVEPSPPLRESRFSAPGRGARGVVLGGVGQDFELLQRRKHVLFLFLLAFGVKRGLEGPE